MESIAKKPKKAKKAQTTGNPAWKERWKKKKSEKNVLEKNHSFVALQ